MLYIGSDHAGFKLKEAIKKHLKKSNVDFFDVGAKNFNPTDDYPVFAKKLAYKVTRNQHGRGIIICGTGLGSCIVVNKMPGIRATSAWNSKTARQAREHLDANVLCLGEKVQTFSKAKKVVVTWLHTDFSGEKRHRQRIHMIP